MIIKLISSTNQVKNTMEMYYLYVTNYKGAAVIYQLTLLKNKKEGRKKRKAIFLFACFTCHDLWTKVIKSKEEEEDSKALTDWWIIETVELIFLLLAKD